MNCLFVEHLTVLDFAYLDIARGLVGESWIVDLELAGDLNAKSMVLDFGKVKKSIKKLLDQHIDHTLVVPSQATELSMQLTKGVNQLVFRSDLGAIEHYAPELAVTALPCTAVNPRDAELYLQSMVKPTLPENIESVRINLRSERIQDAYYHYVHGLKKHDGNCQRIAHGHRSRIQVFVDGQRDNRAENNIALAWSDIYLGSEEDIASRGNGRIRYAYDAPEGHFELAVPELSNDLLTTDTTVEQIAAELAKRVAAMPYLQGTGQTIQVRAYEGVMKGAIATAIS